MLCSKVLIFNQPFRTLITVGECAINITKMVGKTLLVVCFIDSCYMFLCEEVLLSSLSCGFIVIADSFVNINGWHCLEITFLGVWVGSRASGFTWWKLMVIVEKYVNLKSCVKYLFEPEMYMDCNFCLVLMTVEPGMCKFDNASRHCYLVCLTVFTLACMARSLQHKLFQDICS